MGTVSEPVPTCSLRIPLVPLEDLLGAFTSWILASGCGLICIRFSYISFIVYRFLLSLASLLFFIRFNQLIFHAFPKLLSLNFMHDGHAMSEWKP